eukprot:71296-Pleurochrysis_carterae.AAC.2
MCGRIQAAAHRAGACTSISVYLQLSGHMYPHTFARARPQRRDGRRARRRARLGSAARRERA